MRLYLINPYNPHVTLLVSRESRWRRFFITRPLGLLSLASVTPAEWKTTVVDENCIVPSYSAMPRPDLVGISMMTPQAPRTYELASYFRNCGVPVVLGGMHATTRPEEAMEYADSVVKGEADKIWPEVLEDVHRNTLKRVYSGGQVAPADIPPARHDLLPTGYAVASIQTARGCQLRCSFCSISALSGHRRRHRPIDDVVQELKSIREKNVVMVDENLIGFTDEDIARAKDLFHAIIKADLGKKWKAWVTINIADDDELLALAAQAGCSTAIIGFENNHQGGARGDRQIIQRHRGTRFPGFCASYSTAQDFGVRFLPHRP